MPYTKVENIPEKKSFSEIMAIRPEYLSVIQSNILSNIVIDRNQISEKGLVVTESGIAIIPLEGAITKKDSFFSRFFGETSHEQFQNLVQQAQNDEDIKGAVVYIDSPGGVVSGTNESALALADLANKKPTVVFSDGMIASAAYRISIEADSIIVGPSTEVGSIGVVLLHADFSKAYEDRGIKLTEITSGQFKRIASSTSPLSPEGKEYLQGLVDDHFQLFKSAVGESRGLSGDQLNDVSQGQLYVGQKALKAGLIDQIGTLEDAISQTETMVLSNKGGFLMSDKTQITASMIQKDYPEVHTELVDNAVKETRSEVTASVTQEVTEKVTKEVTASERLRIKEILEMAPEGLQKEAMQMAFETDMSSANAAKDLLKLAKDKKVSLYSQHISDSPTGVPSSTGDSEEDPVMGAIEKGAMEANRRRGYSTNIPPATISQHMPMEPAPQN